MSQEETLKMATLPLQESTPVDATGLVGNYADDLISGLFEDVDKLLDGDESALAAFTLTQDIVAVEVSPRAEETAIEAVDPSPSSTSIVPSPQAGDLDLLASAATGQAAVVDATPPKPAKTKLGKLFDRLLLATTALSLLGAGAFVWLSQQSQYAVETIGNGSAATAGSPSDSEFLSYLQRSLDVIASKVEAGATGSQTGLAPSSTAVLPNGTPLLPPLASTTGAGGIAGRSPMNVIERVYIPYQTAQAPVATTPQVVPPAAVLPPAATTLAPAQPAAQAPVHMLVGVLELGDRSAALFEISGVSQRVYIGERVGSSGWSLVSVSNEEAVIRRNGEVRSVYIGQKF